MFPFSNPFYDKPDSSGSGTAIEDKELSKEAVIDFLNEDDEEEKPLDLKEEKKVESKEEKEEKEETEKVIEDIEEELEEPDEEKLELMTPVRRKEILAKYPDLFKTFPYLERAYYREQQFTELLPTIDDAKLAIEKSNTLDNFEKDLLSGNTENILKAVLGHDKNAFNKLVDNYLPALATVDKDAYFHVLGNVVKNTITAMVRESKSSNNEALQSAAQILNQFVFGTSDFTAPTNLTRVEEKNEQEDKIKQREEEFTRRQFDSARDDLSTRIDNTLKATIEANIDPKESMTDYVKRNAIRETLENLQELIDQDTRFSSVLDRLWEKVFQEDFSRASLDRIKSAYLSTAKTLLPSVIKKARNDALRGLGKRVKDDEESSSKKGPAPVGKSASSSQSGKSIREQAKEIPRGMRSVDFLMQE